MQFQLPPLPQFEPSWGAFQVWWQQVKTAIETEEDRQQSIFDALDQILSGAGGLQDQVAILGSFTIPTRVLTASDVGTTVTIAIASHIRHYSGPRNLAIAAGALPGLAFSTKYAVYYDDETRQAAAPTFHATTYLEEAQHNHVPGRHYVGTVVTPADSAGPTTGGSPPAGSGYTAGASAIDIT